MDSKHMFFAEFQRKREAADVKQHELAARLGVDKSTVSRIESGDRVPGRDLVEQAEEILGVTDGILGRLLDELKRQRSVPERFRPWLDIEQQASVIRMVQFLLVPGLLQTPGYARAILKDDDKAAARLERQAILDGLTDAVAIIDEGVLSRPIGSPEVMAEQMARLAGDDRLRVHVLPAAAGQDASRGVFIALQGAFSLATLRSGMEAGLLDNPLGGIVTEAADELAQLRALFEALASDALPRAASRKLIQEAVERWKAQSVTP